MSQETCRGICLKPVWAIGTRIGRKNKLSLDGLFVLHFFFLRFLSGFLQIGFTKQKTKGRKKKMKTTFAKKAATAALTAAVLVSASVTSAFAAQKNEVFDELLKTSEYLLTQNPEAGYQNDYALGAIVSGAADESFKESYILSVEDSLKQNGGKLIFTDSYTGETGESLMYEACAAIALYKMGVDTSDIGGYNLADIISNYDLSLVSNPYHLCEALKAARLTGVSDDVKARLKDAIMAYYTDNGETGGMDYWGISTDNNGVFVEALAPYMDSDQAVKNAVEKSLRYIENMKRADGYDSSADYASEYGNPDSTALALRAFAAVNDSEKADEAYNYLMGFKSSETDGAYLYAGDESVYAAKDAQAALVAYYDYLPANDDKTSTEASTQAVTGSNDTTNSNGEMTFESTTDNKQEITVDSTDVKPSTAQTGDSNPNTGAESKSIAISAAALMFIGIIVSSKKR